MSSKTEDVDAEADEIMYCASCGTAGVDNIKLKKCNACNLVRYCGVKCQREHWRQHKGTCKKRAAELREELLFRQPEHGDLGDCPICLLPFSHDFDKSSIQSCCYKLICNGCAYASLLHEDEGSLEDLCPFCRQPYPESEEEIEKNVMRRIEANDPIAMRQMGVKCYTLGDFRGSIEYLTKATKLGDAGAHCELADSYMNGHGVAVDMKKAFYHFEEAAILGSVTARYVLGVVKESGRGGKTERAVKHFIIGANLGCDKSLKCLTEAYAKGLVKKEDLAAALRTHQAAVDATKSPQRDAAELAEQNEESAFFKKEFI